METQTLSAGIYDRTSKEDKNQKKISTEQQVEKGIEEAAKHNLTVAREHIYIDRDLSGKLPPTCWAGGKKKSRPAFSGLIQAIEEGEIKAVVVRMMDRLARNTLVSLNFLKLCEEKGITLYATDEALPKVIDASGRLQLTVLIAIAEYQREQIVANVKGAKDHQRKHRMKMGAAVTVGYKDGEKGEILKDDDGETIVKEIHTMYQAGKTIGEITRHCQATYKTHTYSKTTKWHNSTVRRILSNVAYIGQGIQGQPRILSDEVFSDTQKALASRRNTKWGVRLEKHLLGGMLKCGECGNRCAISIMYRKEDGGLTNTGIKWGATYRCKSTSNQHPNGNPICINEREWDLWADRFLGTAKRVNGNSDSGVRASLELKKDKIEKNVEGAEGMLASGDIDIAKYKDISSKAKAELSKIDVELSKLVVSSHKSIKPWAEMDIVEKRIMIKEVCESILVFHNGVMVTFKAYVKITEEDTLGNVDFSQGSKVWFPVHRATGKANHKINSLLPDNRNAWQGWRETAVDGQGFVWTPSWGI